MRRSRRRIESTMDTFYRVAWGRRIDTGLSFAAFAGGTTLAFLPGHPVTRIVLALVGGALVIIAPTGHGWSKAVITSLPFGRLFAKATVEAGVAAPSIVRQWAVPSGNRLALALPAGAIAEDYEKASEALAVCFGSQDVRVLRDPANAARAELTIVTCDPLAGAGTPWPWAGTAESQASVGRPATSRTRRGWRPGMARSGRPPRACGRGTRAVKSAPCPWSRGHSRPRPRRRPLVPGRQAGWNWPLAGCRQRAFI